MEIVPPGTNIDFVSRRALFGVISASLVVLSIVLTIVIGPNYGIDFKGGTNIILSFNQPTDPGQVTDAMVGLGFTDAVVQSFGSASDNEFLIQTNRISVITPEDAEHVRQVLIGEFGEEDLVFDYDEESGDRLEVRLPENAFDDLPADWTPGMEANLGTGAGTGEGTAEGTGLAAVEPGPPVEVEETAERVSPQRAYLQHVLLSSGLENVQVSQVGNPRQNRFLIRLQQIQRRISDGMTERFGDAFKDVERVETVGPRVGRQLRDDGIKAVILALFFILVYIGLRFNMRFAPGAVIALFHDVTITLGILVLIREEITLTILAALLTIVGYSLNDTIVVFDRIRENLGSLRTKDLGSIVNQSINETLSRTLLTSLTTLLAVLSIYFLGGGLIKSFALAMIIGIIVGTYSSIYVASPVMMAIQKYLDTRAAKEREARGRGRGKRPSRSGSQRRSP